MCQSMFNRTHAINFLCTIAAGLQWITTSLCFSHQRGFLRVGCLSNEFAMYRNFFFSCLSFGLCVQGNFETALL